MSGATQVVLLVVAAAARRRCRNCGGTGEADPGHYAPGTCSRCHGTGDEPAPPEPPYPWCMHPAKCIERGYCPRNPSCGD